MFFGKDLIVWLLLALGGALFVGNVMAVVKPPTAPRKEGDLQQAPRSRSLGMAASGSWWRSPPGRVDCEVAGQPGNSPDRAVGGGLAAVGETIPENLNNLQLCMSPRIS
jgi:hypothetical protein